MSLKIVRVVNESDPEVEYVVLTTSTDINIKGYALMDSTFNNKGKLSNEYRHIYEFPDLDIKKGDFIRVYSGTDKPYKANDNKADTKTHYLYWGSKGFIWNDNGRDMVRLIKIEPIDSKKVEKPKKS